MNNHIVFQDIKRELNKVKITDINDAELFFKLLMEKSNGCVNVDLLGAEMWDRIESYSVDKINKVINICWIDNRIKKYSGFEQTVYEEAIRSTFGGDVCGVSMHFQEIRIEEPIKNYPFFVIKGYAVSHKEIKQALSGKSVHFAIEKDCGNFCSIVRREANNFIEIYHFINAAVYSVLLLPKGIRWTGTDSRKYLLWLNLTDAYERISSITNKFTSPEISDRDFIGSQGNAIRTIFESVLKLECIYRSFDIKLKDYSKSRLGELSSLVKKSKHKKEKDLLLNIEKIAPKLSHDTGKPISGHDVYCLGVDALSYIQLLIRNTQKKSFQK